MEIFRNAYAVDLYHDSVPYKIFDCCGVCEMMSLMCRQGFVDIETVYGDPDECKKTGTYFGPDNSGTEHGKGRCNGTGLVPWGDKVPTKNELLDRFGDFHYGWVGDEAIATPEVRDEPNLQEKAEAVADTAAAIAQDIGNLASDAANLASDAAGEAAKAAGAMAESLMAGGGEKKA